MDYDALAQQIHQNARDKGFWDKERDMDEMLMLAVSELAEGLEEHRDGKPVIYFKHKLCSDVEWESDTVFCDDRNNSCNPKPEGLAIEIADFIIRCLDTLQSVAYPNTVTDLIRTSQVLYARKMPEATSARLFNITRFTCRAVNEEGQFNRLWLARACHEAVNWLDDEITGDALMPIEIKMRYNATRERLHGKAY